MYKRQVYEETKIIFPEITGLTYSEAEFNAGEDTLQIKQPLVIYESSKQLSTKDELKLKNWLTTKFRKDSVEIYYRKQDNNDHKPAK